VAPYRDALRHKFNLLRFVVDLFAVQQIESLQQQASPQKIEGLQRLRNILNCCGFVQLVASAQKRIKRIGDTRHQKVKTGKPSYDKKGSGRPRTSLPHQAEEVAGSYS